MRLKKIAQSILPTRWGKFSIIAFEESNKKKNNNHIALIYGNIYRQKKTILARIHSECLTGDSLFSLRCDCGIQLKTSLNIISQEGAGILIYHRQEGRNIGLINKIKAYALQDMGLDTVEANHKLGFLSDERDFKICSDIFKLLKIKKIRLLTNNPKKVKILSKHGIQIQERVSLIVGLNKINKFYVHTKKNKMGHFF
ncbi:GTP cyclohydrolase II [Buchnera aphidicola]|uniref:GTP cyclohydrolase II n=1 Tax=Buchnera aphidicola TaxID=9 RepID=UPI002238FF08|nr:GTP cyclohydrolase II [Buchnera aphidicola]MCW5197685.1 GTP cyclohydrolase II [Buchnera aphidicola (Chaitophorus viminalis)]